MAETTVSLPAFDAAPRCAPWSRDHGLAPAGTAIRADRLLLLDVPLPWPKPIRDHPRLLGMMDVAGGAAETTRLLASLPADDRIRLTVFHNAAGIGERSTYLIGSEAAIPAAIAAVVRDETSPEMKRIEERDARPSLLVCTQGSHDVCCGSDGVRFATDVERSHPDIAVYRVSHTGGHRFAPTAMSFPDGRMWAWLDVDDVAQIFGRNGDHRDLAARCRGWWGAEKGAQQTAEVALFSARGWALDETDRHVTGDVPEVGIAAAGDRFRVDVQELRTVPAIACRAAGGLPAKEAVEYAATIR